MRVISQGARAAGQLPDIRVTHLGEAQDEDLAAAAAAEPAGNPRYDWLGARGYDRTLQNRCASLAPLVDPERERRARAALLAELSLSSCGRRPDRSGC